MNQNKNPNQAPRITKRHKVIAGLAATAMAVGVGAPKLLESHDSKPVVAFNTVTTTKGESTFMGAADNAPNLPPTTTAASHIPETTTSSVAPTRAPKPSTTTPKVEQASTPTSTIEVNSQETAQQAANYYTSALNATKGTDERVKMNILKGDLMINTAEGEKPVRVFLLSDGDALAENVKWNVATKQYDIGGNVFFMEAEPKQDDLEGNWINGGGRHIRFTGVTEPQEHMLHQEVSAHVLKDQNGYWGVYEATADPAEGAIPLSYWGE